MRKKRTKEEVLAATRASMEKAAKESAELLLQALNESDLLRIAPTKLKTSNTR